MLTDEQIEQNREIFLKTLAEISLEQADIPGLVDFLDNSDFFDAPASAKYHLACRGGLCQHSLNVYYTMLDLYEKYKDIIPEYSKDTLIIVSLLHDLSKTNYYEETVFNKKIYSEKGLKKDNKGKFDWFAEPGYRVKDAEDRELLGTHEETSALIVSRYVPLTQEELIAIMHHQAIPSEGDPLRDMSAMLNKYPLITLLQMSDFLATFILERN